MWRGSDSRVAGCHLQCLCRCVCAFCHCSWRRRRSGGKAAHCKQQTDALSPQGHNMYSFVGGICIMESRMRSWSRLDKINADLRRGPMFCTGRSCWWLNQEKLWNQTKSHNQALIFENVRPETFLRYPRGYVQRTAGCIWSSGWALKALT